MRGRSARAVGCSDLLLAQRGINDGVHPIELRCVIT